MGASAVSLDRAMEDSAPVGHLPNSGGVLRMEIGGRRGTGDGERRTQICQEELGRRQGMERGEHRSVERRWEGDGAEREEDKDLSGGDGRERWGGGEEEDKDLSGGGGNHSSERTRTLGLLGLMEVSMGGKNVGHADLHESQCNINITILSRHVTV